MNAGKNWVHCPRCEKSYPPGNPNGQCKTGHCGTCHETFYGLTAWDSHRRGPHGPERHCIDPATDKKSTWWLDDSNRWHLGEQLTDADKERIFGGRS